jgi:hypothetical protein
MPSLAHHPDDHAATIVAAHMELTAQCAGWRSAIDREVARVELASIAWRCIEWQTALGVILPTFAHLEEIMLDRFQAGAVTLPVTPWKDGALGAEVLHAAKVVFRTHQERERRAAMGDALACCDDDSPHPLDVPPTDGRALEFADDILARVRAGRAAA